MIGNGRQGQCRNMQGGDSAYGDGTFIEYWVWLATLKAASFFAPEAHALEPAAAPAVPSASDGGGIPADQCKERQAILGELEALRKLLDSRPAPAVQRRASIPKRKSL